MVPGSTMGAGGKGDPAHREAPCEPTAVPHRPDLGCPSGNSHHPRPAPDHRRQDPVSNPRPSCVHRDMVDGNSGSMERYAPILQGIAPPFGKYAVTGNHECYVGLGPSVEALQSFGFIVLRDTRASVGNVLNMVGVDDPAGGSRREETDLLSGINNGLFTVLLKHRPEVTKASRGLFDLQLSGHTHGGQIFPFGFLPACSILCKTVFTGWTTVPTSIPAGVRERGDLPCVSCLLPRSPLSTWSERREPHLDSVHGVLSESGFVPYRKN